MEEVAKGKRGGPRERDVIKKTCKAYVLAASDVTKLYEQVMSGAFAENGKKISFKSPNFVEIILKPVVQKLGEVMPEYDVGFPVEGALPDDNGYFRICIGGKVVVGVNFGGPNAHFIKVTVFAHNRPWGNALKIGNMKALCAVMEFVIQIMDIPKKTNHEQIEE